ncbi:MAG: hypothetical protein KC620_05505 [Myxococcales bacterium]|nr:hypothetical protein [Myxococcales bacterium]
MRRFLLVIALLVTGGCDDSNELPADAAMGGDAAVLPDGQVGACLDQPGALPMPPGATLPCELYPPR